MFDMTSNNDGAASIYLVVEDDPFVATDLKESLNELRQGAEVHLAANVVHARDLIAQLPSLQTAVIGVTYREARESGLLDEVERRGGRVVLIEGLETENGVPQDWVQGWVVLPKPFSTQMLRESLDRAEMQARS